MTSASKLYITSAILLVSLLTSLQSQAEVFKCTPTIGIIDTSFIVALTTGQQQDNGLFYVSRAGTSEYQKGHVIVDRTLNQINAADPILVTFQPNVKINWKKEKECFVFAEQIIRLEIYPQASATDVSTYQILPNIKINPKVKDCEHPLVKPARPQPAICESL